MNSSTRVGEVGLRSFVLTAAGTAGGGRESCSHAVDTIGTILPTNSDLVVVDWS